MTFFEIYYRFNVYLDSIVLSLLDVIFFLFNLIGVNSEFEISELVVGSSEQDNNR